MNLGRDKSLLSGMSTNRRTTTMNLFNQESSPKNISQKHMKTKKILNVVSGPISDNHSLISLKSDQARLSPQIMASIESIQQHGSNIKNNY